MLLITNGLRPICATRGKGFSFRPRVIGNARKRNGYAP